jgi:hypothetical protein
MVVDTVVEVFNQLLMHNQVDLVVLAVAVVVMILVDHTLVVLQTELHKDFLVE